MTVKDNRVKALRILSSVRMDELIEGILGIGPEEILQLASIPAL